MTYRPIAEEEIAHVADIQARAFRQPVEGYLERYSRGDRIDWREVRVWENEKALPVAALGVFQREMALNGGELTAGLVNGVAVPPEQRRRGYAGRLMAGLLDELYRHEVPISLLFPFSVRYYQRLGYGLASMNWFLEVPPGRIPAFPERMSVRRATAEDRAAIRARYEEARREPQHNGWLSRTDWEWAHRFWKEGREAVVCPASGEIEGYLLYELTGSYAETTLKLAEWVALSDAAWRGLAGFLSAQGEQVRAIRYNAPGNDPLLLVQSEPYSTTGAPPDFVNYQAARLLTGFMLRVVHLPAALRARRYPPDLEAELLLRVEDKQLAGNRQPLHLHVAEGAASVALARGLFPGSLPTGIETDAATFGQLYAGTMSAEQARKIGRLRADDATCALLTRVFAAAPFYMQRTDWF